VSSTPTEFKTSLLNYWEMALRLSPGCYLRITVQEILLRQQKTPGSGFILQKPGAIHLRGSKA